MTSQTAPSALPVVDLPEVFETFADSTHLVNFDANTFRVVFTVTRPTDVVPGKPMTFKQYPCARIVMPAAAGLEFFEKLRQLVDMMIKQGVLKPITQPPSGAHGTTKPN